MSMSVFDIIGPVMIGPSSSHTAGVVRIGNVVRCILGSTPARATVQFHGSFATTYRGHGSDRAVVAGMLGMSTDDEGIRDSIALAAEMGYRYHFQAVPHSEGYHPNTLVIDAEDCEGGALSVVGYSIGGGNIMIVRINNIQVEFTGKFNTLIVGHRDTPGVVARVTQVLAAEFINIANMKVYRSLRGGDAIMIIETDQTVGVKLTDRLSEIEDVSKITSLPSLF